MLNTKISYGMPLCHAKCKLRIVKCIDKLVKRGYNALFGANSSILYILNAVFKTVASLLVNKWKLLNDNRLTHIW